MKLGPHASPRAPTPAETCDLLSVVYDASGRRVREQTATASRWFRGEEYVSTVAEGRTVQRVEVRAFGERVAYVHYERSETAAAPLVLRGAEVPPWAPGLVPLAVLLGAFGFALRGGIALAVARRPGPAGVVGLVSVSLVLAPFPVRGGGRDVQTYLRWVLSDPLGSAHTELDAAGAVVRQVRSRPFGGVDAAYDLAPGAHARSTWAGHDRQAETGLVYMKARWMDPQTGTFISVDPVVAAVGDPQSYNGYAYARNNPVSYNDPTGKNIETITITAAPNGHTYLSWMAMQDAAIGGALAAVASQFRSGEAHVVRGFLEGTGGGGAANPSGYQIQLVAEIRYGPENHEYVYEVEGRSQGNGGRSEFAGVHAQYGGEMLDNGIPADGNVRQFVKDFHLAFGPKDDVAGLDPGFRLKLGRVMNELRGQGFSPRVYDGVRTLAEQRAHVASGASQTLNSLHLQGRAADLADTGTWFTLGTKDPFLHALGRSAASHGLVWGGNWKTLVDMHHVQDR